MPICFYDRARIRVQDPIERALQMGFLGMSVPAS